MDLKDILLAEVNNVLDVYKGYLSELTPSNIIRFLRDQDERFDKAIGIVEGIISGAHNLEETDAKTLSIKAATVFILSLWSKLGKKGSSDRFSDEDWNDIAQSVFKYAVVTDAKNYCKLVFVLYRQSIEYALEKMRSNAEDDSVKRIKEIVKQLKKNEDRLDKGTISKVAFVDDDLWLCLEAVFIVLADRTGLQFGDGKYQELSNALGAIIFQKIRLSVYENELQALEDCLKEQQEIDYALSAKLDDYIMQLKDELDRFDAAVEEAFSSVIRTAFAGSAKLAAITGADEILDSIEDVDDFFM